MKNWFGEYIMSALNPFLATGLFLYPLKTSQNQRFSNVYRGYWKRPLIWNGFMRWLERHVLEQFATVIPNPFYATYIFLHPLKTSEKKRFSDVFRGHRKRPIEWNRLMCLIIPNKHYLWFFWQYSIYFSTVAHNFFSNSAMELLM